MNKDELRKIIINKRKNIINKKELSKVIVNNIINLDIYKKAKLIALYNSLNSEVDISFLINTSLNDKIVLLPRIINDKMEFIVINKDTIYTKSNFGVLEPIGDIYSDIIDLIIVPGVSFDKMGNRLGYGKGYYDKYLQERDIYKIGICFSGQMVDQLPHNELDIPMDMVITNDSVYNCSK